MEGQLLDLLGRIADVADKLSAFALALFVVIMFTTGRWALGSKADLVDKHIADAAAAAVELDKVQALDYQRQLEWLDARRKEERDDRMAAEATMRNLIDKFDDIIELVKGLGDEVKRARRA